MTETQSNLPYEIVITKDGSPSLAFFKDGFSQMMHSSQGAFSETEFVYGKALDMAFENFHSLQILSVGLGFGYVEISAVTRRKMQPLQITSYEKDKTLRQYWLDFINDRPSIFTESYKKIFSLYSEKYQIDSLDIKNFFKTDLFVLRDDLQISQPPKEKFNCILFDPFCSKFSPEFWSEADLTHFIQAVSAEQCVFSTYAATGALTRSLKAAGFKKIKNKGFAGKREFTLAIKNISL